MKASFEKSRLLKRVQQAYAAGELSEPAYQRASALLYEAPSLKLGISHLLLGLGTTQVLAGIVFFFAYNWAELGTFQRFGLLEVGLVVCTSAAAYKNLNTLTGRYLMLAAGLILGVLLATFGQVYQLGADAYEIYIAWAVLVLPWVLLTRFEGLWLLFAGVAQVGMLLGFSQWDVPFEIAMTISAVFYGLLVLLEKFWPAGHIPGTSALLATLTCLCVPTLAIIAEMEVSTIWQGLVLVLWLGTSLFALWYYRGKVFHGVALATLSLALVATGLCCRMLVEAGDEAGLLFSGVVIVVAATVVSKRLHHVWRKMGATS